MSLNIKTDDGYISVAGGSVEPLKYTAITGAGVTVNNDPESTGYRTIENTGVLSIETGESKTNANGTILVQTGVASATNPAVAIAVKGLNNAAYKDVDTKVDSTTKTSEKLPTTKAVYDTLKKIEDGVFQRDTDAVSVKTVPSGVKNYAVVEKIYGKTVKKNLWDGITEVGAYDTSTGAKMSNSNRRNVNPIYPTDKNITVDTKTGVRLYYYSSSGYLSTELLGDVGVYNKTIPDGTTYINVASSDTALGADVVNIYCGLSNAVVESVVSQSANMWDQQWELGSIDASGSSITYPSSTTQIRTKNFIEVKPNTTYYFKNPFAVYVQIPFFDKNKNYISFSSETSNQSFNFTTPANCYYIKFRTNNTVTTYSSGCGIYETDSSTDYTPYFHNEIELSEAIKSLPDFGMAVSDTLYNYIDFETGKYYHNVGSVDLGSLTWKPDGTDYSYTSELQQSIGSRYQGICGKFTYGGDSSVSPTDKTKWYLSGSGYFELYTVGISDVKGSLSGVYLNYELKSPEVKDISDIIRPIKCETGGTITLKNEHNLDVANTIIYEKEVL